MDTSNKKYNSCKHCNNGHINRRIFLSKGISCVSALAFLSLPEPMHSMLPKNQKNKQDPKDDTKKIFMKKGPCSSAFFFLLNREFDKTLEKEEKASSPLAGGIVERGFQCGMLWGSTLAVGAEAYKRYPDKNEAQNVAVSTTQFLVDSFNDTTGTMNCREITNVDLSKPLGVVKLIVTSAKNCMNLAEDWAPKSYEAAHNGLTQRDTDNKKSCLNCASELAKQIGATDEQKCMVSGFAGGMGLSGNACGALAAAVWFHALKWLEKNPGKNYPNKKADFLLEAFDKATDSTMECSKITGTYFSSISEHSDYIQKGGCKHIMQALVDAVGRS